MCPRNIHIHLLYQDLISIQVHELDQSVMFLSARPDPEREVTESDPSLMGLDSLQSGLHPLHVISVVHVLCMSRALFNVCILLQSHVISLKKKCTDTYVYERERTETISLVSN